MTSFRWLHLTDLHRGMAEEDWLWPNLEELFLKDLGKLYELCGPWDLVLFTGDLTQRGGAEEFARLDRLLEKVWTHLRSLSPDPARVSDPVLLAVPGNHDLARPRAADPEALIFHWAENPGKQTAFWRDPSSPSRRMIESAFSGYQAWWRARRPNIHDYREGLLPGDFSATLEKDGIRLGIVGLNSAFLQLRSGITKGCLDLSPAQFHGACGGNGVEWIQDRHLVLLMTHHPPDWLSPAGLQSLQGEIAPPDRFAVHLFGHQHEAATTHLAIDAQAPWRRWQGDALFGLETWGEGGQGRRRHHGYSAGAIRIEGKRAFLRLWPRKAVRREFGPWRLVPAFESFELMLDQGTAPEKIALRREPPAERALSPDLHRLIARSARKSSALVACEDGTSYAPPILENPVFTVPNPHHADYDLDHRVLVGTRIKGCVAHGIRFGRSDLTGMRWQASQLIRVQFKRCCLSGLVIYDCALKRCSFYACDLVDAFFCKVHFDKVYMENCNVENPIFHDCTIGSLTFDRCRFSNHSESELRSSLGGGAQFLLCEFGAAPAAGGASCRP